MAWLITNPAGDGVETVVNPQLTNPAGDGLEPITRAWRTNDAGDGIELFYARSFPYLFARASGNQAPLRAYRIMVGNNNELSFTLLTNTVASPQSGQDAGAVAVVDGQMWVAWKGGQAQLQRVELNSDGLVGGDVFPRSADFTYTFVGLFQVGSAMYGVDPNGDIHSIAIDETNMEYAGTVVAHSGTPPGNVGGIAHLGNVRYAVGNTQDGNSDLDMASLSDSFAYGSLTGMPYTAGPHVEIEAAIGIGDAIYTFERLSEFQPNNRRIFRTTISGGAATTTQLTGSTPAGITTWSAANV